MLRVAILCLCIASTAHSEPPTPSATEAGEPQKKGTGEAEKTANKNNSATKVAPLIIEQAPAQPAYSKAPKKKNTTQDKSTDDRIIGGIAAFFAGLSALISAFALWGARNALHKSQRPWVEAESITLREPILFNVRGAYEINAHVTIRNTGNSLAKGVLMSVKLVANTGNEMIKDWQSLKFFEDHKRIASGSPWPLGVVIAPSQSVSLPYGWGAATVDVERIKNGGFYLMGYVEYFDQFNKRHYTRFAFNPNGDSVHPWDKKTFVLSGGFHEAD